MTNEEAVKILRRIQEPEAWEPQINGAAFEALDMAIEALGRQQASGSKDLISRQSLLAKYDGQHEGPPGRARKLIEDEPPALGTNLAEDGTDLISRAQAIDVVKRLSLGETDATRLAMRIGDYLERLPSAPPKMGKWVYHIDDLFPAESTMECNQCHAEQPLTCDDEFCPHCGADMREVTT